MRFIVFSLIAALVPAALFAGPDTTKRLEEGYVIKQITIPQGQERADVLVEALINSPPESVWAALVDIESWPRWLPMTSKASFLSDQAAGLVTPDMAKDRTKVLLLNSQYPSMKRDMSGHWQRVAFEEYDLPWPIKNEWIVRRYNYDEGAEGFRASWRSIDSKKNEDDGYWEVKPWGDSRSYLKYCYRVKPKENVPDVVFKTAVSFTVNSMIKALKHEASRREAGTSNSYVRTTSK